MNAIILALLMATIVGTQSSAAESSIKHLLDKGQAALESQDSAKAQQLYKQVIKLDPKNSEAYAGLGWALHQAGHYKQAIEHENISIRLDHKNAVPHYYLAAIYMMHNKVKEGQKEFAIALRLPTPKKRPCKCPGIKFPFGPSTKR